LAVLAAQNPDINPNLPSDHSNYLTVNDCKVLGVV